MRTKRTDEGSDGKRPRICSDSIYTAALANTSMVTSAWGEGERTDDDACAASSCSAVLFVAPRAKPPFCTERLSDKSRLGWRALQPDLELGPQIQMR